MSAETQPQPSERLHDNQADLGELAKQRLEHLRHQGKHETSEAAANRAEAAREVIEQADKPKEAPKPSETAPEPSEAPNRPSFIPPALNYQHTLASMQQHLKPAARTFSRIIHQPVVEATSEVLAKTVVRPSVINGALWTAVLVGGAFYVTARMYGFVLSGSEMLFALLGGGIIGVLGEIIWRAFKRS